MHKPRGILLLAVAVIVVGALVIAQEAQHQAAGVEEEDAALATQFFDEITAAPYTEWAFSPNVPEGFYVGIEPHGMILRVFINDVAVGDIEDGRLVGEAFSDRAIIVKENHMPGDVDVEAMELQAPVPDFEGALDALTFMVKIPGYNPEGGDWFWAKMAPDGELDVAGRAEGCVACHSQAVHQDFAFNVRAADDARAGN